MKFGKHFERELVPQWRQHYIQYNDLKHWIKEEERSGGYTDGIAFNREVEEQVNHVMRFYQQQRTLLQNDVDAAERQRILLAQSYESRRSQRAYRESLLLEYHRLGEQLLQIFHYLELNSVALRKINKKYLKRVRTADRTILSMAKSEQTSQLAENLKRMKDFTLLQPFVDTIRQGIIHLESDLRLDMRKDRRPDPSNVGPEGSNQFGSTWSPIPAIRFKQYKRHGHAIVQDLSLLQSKLHESTSFLDFLSLQSAIPFQRQIIRSQSSMALARRSQIMPLYKLRSNEEDGTEDSAFQEASNLSLKIDDASDEEILYPKDPAYAKVQQDDYESATLTDSEEDAEDDFMSQYINLGSTFFYLCNYNICLPTSGEYAAHMGLEASTSGVIVAMTPVAALISAIAYSYWSNFSFRKPLLCSSVLLVCGNLLYALAWDANVTSMILLGRFVTGLGGARAVNRRYIADSIRVEHRTRASAAFVAAGALGMACGPFLASIFSGFDMLIFGLTFNEMTAPAFFMAVVWVVFGFMVLVFFREPSNAILSKIPEDRERSESGISTVYDDFLDDDDDEDDDDDSVYDPLQDASESASYMSGVRSSNVVSTSGDPWGKSRQGFFSHRSEDEVFNDGIDIVLDAPTNMSQDGDANEDRVLLENAHESVHLNRSPFSPQTRMRGSGDAATGNYGSFGTSGEASLNASVIKGKAHTMKTPLAYKPLMGKDQLRARRRTLRFRLTLLCLWVIFWVKLVQEALLTALPLTLPSFIGWGSGRIGIFMACLGLSVVPFNMILVNLSRLYGLRDTFWVRYLQVPLILGASMLAWDPATQMPALLFVGYFVVFVSSQVMEAVIMAYFSKVIDARLAAGTFNSGLLATEAGTFGRAAGNALITAFRSGTASVLHEKLYGFDALVTIPTFLVTFWLTK